MDIYLTDESQPTATPVRCGTCEMLQHAPLACQDCHQLMDHVQGVDYFELFGIARAYSINVDELGRRYLSISRNIHPDKFANTGAEMQSFALRMSAAVNRAHDVLRDPFLRAEYLLETAGGPSAAQDKSVPGDLLGDVMTLREDIDVAQSTGDTESLRRIQVGVDHRKQEIVRRIEEICATLDTGTDAAKAELRQQLNALKYLNNLLLQSSADTQGATR